MIELGEIPSALPALKLFIPIIFYLVTFSVLLSSAIALYSLFRYGKDRVIITSVATTYIIIITVLFFIARNQMHHIQF